MKKRVVNTIMVLFCAVLITGCGNTIPELTEEQKELVVGYAAEMVLKHSQNYDYKLIELTEEQEMEQVPGEEQQNTGEQEELSDSGKTAEEVPVLDKAEEAAEEITSIEDFLKLDTVKITYTGYKITDLYPEEGEELYFIMNATEGNKLLVLTFSAENTSGSELELDMADSNVRFRIVTDGVTKNALTTLLLNDLTYYKGTIGAGESTELVLVCEVPEDVEEISTLELIMRNADDRATISLN